MTTSTPTDLFSNLSLDSSMAPSSQQVRERAVEIQDILSSFDRQNLPLETSSEVFARIDHPQNLRLQTRSDWTVQGDLNATLLQWGAYDENAYEFLQQLQSPNTLARCFYEKLGRRISDCINEYDTLTETVDTVEALYRATQNITTDLRKLVAAAAQDREHRELGEEETLRHLLKLLVEVCIRSNSLLGQSRLPMETRRSQRRSSSLSTMQISLFDLLIGRQRSGDDNEDDESSDEDTDEDTMFMLDTLEQFSARSLQNCSNTIDAIVGHLRTVHARSAYAARLEALKYKTDDSPSTTARSAGATPRRTQQQYAGPSSASATGSGRRSAVPTASPTGSTFTPAAEPRTGTKRPPSTAEGSGRRGRKRTGR